MYIFRAIAITHFGLIGCNMRDIEIMMHVLEKCSHFCCCSILDNRAFSCHPLHLICSQWIGRWYYWDEENWNTKTNTWINHLPRVFMQFIRLLINVVFRFKQFKIIIISFIRNKITKKYTHIHSHTHNTTWQINEKIA